MIRSYRHGALAALGALGLLVVLGAPPGLAFPDPYAPQVRIVGPPTVLDEIGRDATVASGTVQVRVVARHKREPGEQDRIKYLRLMSKRGHGSYHSLSRWDKEARAVGGLGELDTTQLPNDLYTLRAVASDKDSGNRGTPPTGTAEYGVGGRHEIRLYVDNGPTAPQVAFTGPTPGKGASVSGLIPLRILSADKEGVERLLIRAYRPDGSVDLCRTVRGDHDLIFWDTMGHDYCSPNGRYTLIVRAVDRDRLNRTWLYDGTVSDAVTTVVVNNGPNAPRIAFEEPTPMDGNPTGGRLTLKAWADDPEGIAYVNFSVYNAAGALVWWVAKQEAPYTIQWDTFQGDRAVPDGQYALVATAVDRDTLNPSDRYPGTAADTRPVLIRISNKDRWQHDDVLGG